ncbi:hypothetical protein Tco_1373098, partial [Tanacetum coccineum]
MFNGGVEMLSLYMRCSTEESICYRYTLDVQRMSRDATLYMRCSTDESRFCRYTLNVQQMSRDAIVVHDMSRDAIVRHEIFNGGVDMLSLHMRCSTDESRCYRCTLDVQRGSRDAICRVRGTKFDWFIIVSSSYSIPSHAINMWLVTRKWLLTQDRMRQWDVVGNQVLNTTNIHFASSKWSDIVDWLLPFTNRNNVTSIGDRRMVDGTHGKNTTTELTGK